MMKFPDAGLALFDLLEQPGSPATPAMFLTTNKYGEIAGPFPYAYIVPETGHVRDIDRVDELSIEVYAKKASARLAAEEILTYLCGEQINTKYGFLDNIDVISTPSSAPWPSQTVEKAVMRVHVIARPIP